MARAAFWYESDGGTRSQKSQCFRAEVMASHGLWTVDIGARRDDCVPKWATSRSSQSDCFWPPMLCQSIEQGVGRQPRDALPRMLPPRQLGVEGRLPRAGEPMGEARVFHGLLLLGERGGA